MNEKTYEQMKLLKLNSATKEELVSLLEADVQDPIEEAMNHIGQKIDDIKHSNGKKIRSTHRDSLKIIMEALLRFVLSNKEGNCAPSMRTIACAINPSLEPIQESDDLDIKKHKENMMANTLMRVSRAIKTLRKEGLIIVHMYRADTNRNDDPKNPNLRNENFYYEIPPISFQCETFKEWMLSLFESVREKVAEVFTEARRFIKNIINKSKELCGIETSPLEEDQLVYDYIYERHPDLVANSS